MPEDATNDQDPQDDSPPERPKRPLAFRLQVAAAAVAQLAQASGVVPNQVWYENDIKTVVAYAPTASP